MNLSDYTAPPRKLKVGGGQDGGEAGAARASCLPHVVEMFFVFPPKILKQHSDQNTYITREGPYKLGGLAPLGY